MRKYAFLLFVMGLVGCQQLSVQPLRLTTETFQATQDLLPTAEPADTDSVARRQQLRKEELDYYMQRHNVQDEGYEMVAHYVYFGDSTLTTYLPHSPLKIWNIGQWRGIAKEGTGVGRDDITGQITIGTWKADTLCAGIQIDSLGFYAGMLNAVSLPNGHGSYTTPNAFYEGFWVNGLRDGFGYNLTFDHDAQLLAGIWRNGHFKGERMSYTTERIYGIDVSRHQHEKGRKRFSIDWSNLRITSLGKTSNKNVVGQTDYPISFAYLKATEGTTVFNRYYANDYMKARKNGIRVGAYHFFSTKSNGTAQAKFFVNNSMYHKDDFPPVLDIEPTEAAIARMGGEKVMFREIRAWLNFVERFTHVRPILYVSQTFIKKHLANAPDLKQNYKVWIARYGEYKPDVKLVFWQLSPYGRVRGIEGDVDINVFNGYSTHWNQFLEEECVNI